MGRKKAMAFNAPGGTSGYIDGESANRIQNGGYHRAVTTCSGVNVYGGTDYSYSVHQNGKQFVSRAFRSQFEMLNNRDYEMGYDSDIIPIAIRRADIAVWCFFGVRVRIEFFDENAIVDFVDNIFPDANKQYAIGKFLVKYSKGYDLAILNDHLIDVRASTRKQERERSEFVARMRPAIAKFNR